MPIEIKELYIKINVKEENKAIKIADDRKNVRKDDEIIATSVEEVMELLQKQKER